VKRGGFIVLEGPDKCGKSTQARKLVERLKSLKIGVVHTREPGGTSFAEEIRRILLDPEHRVEPLAELLLYEAARAQHTEETLRPALRAGKLVVCERYTLSTLVYQGFARGLDLGAVRKANRLATGGLLPDLTIVFDIPDRAFTERDATRRPDRLEREPGSFRRRVRLGYRRLKPRGAMAIDGRRPLEEIHETIFDRVRRQFLGGRA
jgi:dTMP kinase